MACVPFSGTARPCHRSAAGNDCLRASSTARSGVRSATIGRRRSMIPYHDENDTVRLAIVTLAIIAICTLMWLLVQGAGADYSLAESVCNLGLIPGELTQTLSRDSSFRSAKDSPASSIPAAVSQRVDVDVPARRLDAPDRQHVVSLAVRQQRRGFDGPPRFVVFYLLCGLGRRCAQVLASPIRSCPWSAHRARSAA